MDLEAAVGPARLPARHELAGADDLGAALEHLAGQVGIEHRAHRGCVGVGHVGPADGAVLVRDLLEHVERGVDVGFEAAELLRDLEVVEARLRRAPRSTAAVMVSSRSVASASASTSGRSDRAVDSRSFMALLRAVGRRRCRSGRSRPGPRAAGRRRSARRGTRRPRSRGHVDAGRFRTLGEPRRVVEQQLGRADLQQQRRQPRQIREERRRSRRSSIDLAQVGIGHEGEGCRADHRIRIAVHLQARCPTGSGRSKGSCRSRSPASDRRGRGAR